MRQNARLAAISALLVAALYRTFPLLAVDPCILCLIICAFLFSGIPKIFEVFSGAACPGC